MFVYVTVSVFVLRVRVLDHLRCRLRARVRLDVRLCVRFSYVFV